MSRLVLIDGNSIMNRAFYGIMGSKMLVTPDGTYTNAIYGFLNILFKILEDLNPEYLCVAFDLKAPTARHKLYEGYKANRHAMPEELVTQMPLIKDILRAMNISIIEKEGYEADDIIGTLSKTAEKEGLDVTILSGDRDNFQLVSDKIIVRIPRTKMGKTETEDYDKEKILEEYGLEPKKLIEVKGLMGDTSDNIPGVPGVGEKTALNLIKKYKTIDNLYKNLEQDKADDVKGKLREKLVNNKELALLSKTLGTINIKVPLDDKIDDLTIKEWNNEDVIKLFKKLRLNRFIERFNLSEIEINESTNINDNLFKINDINEDTQLEYVLNYIKQKNEMIYYFNYDTSKSSIINKSIKNVSIYNEDENIIYFIKNDKILKLKEVFESKNIKKIGYMQKENYIVLKENNISPTNFTYDIEIAAYILNPTASKYEIDNLADEYLDINVNEYLEKIGKSNSIDSMQINLFDNISDEENNENEKYKSALYVYCINKIYNITEEKLKNTNQLELFNNIEMPLVEVLADMQYEGIYLDKNELIEFGKILQERITKITQDIYNLAGEEFNINSTKQLGEILFEKLKLPVYKKTKNGYSTDVDVLEKLKNEHEIINKILEYRQLVKLNSTYVEGLLPYINPKTNRIHSYFHQTVTATGRISSTEPNLQNIPTRVELGKKLRKVFKPKDNSVFIDADYSQIELRVLSHIADDEHMIDAFNKDEDIHAQAASKVFGIPLEEVTKEKRSEAKAVNFGIVYGISDFGLAGQLGISRKLAKTYIDQYLEKYPKIKLFMDNIVEEAKENGYVETLFHRRRYIPEISSNNYMVRQFGNRVAMNAPIQGTAADIMKIAMINVYNSLKNNNLEAKLLLQIHDELLIESPIDEKERVKEILRKSMEDATKLKVPLKVDLNEADTWYDVK